MLRFHGSRAKKDFELRRLQLAPRRDPGGDAARSSCRTSTAGTRRAARRPRATPSSASARSPSCRRTSRATSTTCTACARPSATGSPRRSPRPRSASRRYYTPPLHLQPALRYLGYSEGDLPETEKAARENLCLPMWGGISRGAAGARSSRCSRQASSLVTGVIALPVTRHRLWQLLADAVLIVARVVARVLPAASTRTSRASTATSSRGRCRGRARDQPRRRSSSSASTTAGGATSRPATCGAPRAA